MGVAQPCFFIQKNNKLNGIERLSDKNQKNLMTNENNINIGVQKRNNNRKRNSIEIPKNKKLKIIITKQNNKILMLPELKPETHEQNNNENIKCKIIKKKKRYKSPNLLKTSNILNDENILIKKNFIFKKKRKILHCLFRFE